MNEGKKNTRFRKLSDGMVVGFFCLVLLYGAVLFCTIPLPYFDFKMPSYFPYEISRDYEAAFTEGMTQHRYPGLIWLAKMKWRYLDTPFIHKVEKGKDGWLFLLEEVPGRNGLFQSLGVQRYTAQQCQLWALLFRQRREWLTDQGIAYTLVVPPNKETIYPEMLPSRYHPASATTTVDQLKTVLPELHWIDLRPYILAQKKQGRLLYYPGDTHWNDDGSMLGYKEIMERLPAPFSADPLADRDLVLREFTYDSGDLMRLMLMDTPEGKPVLRRVLKAPKAQALDDLPVEPEVPPRRYKNPEGMPYRVLFQHDSFFREIFAFFAEHYQSTAFYWKWQGFNADFIKEYQPQLVVDEMIERAFIGDKPRNPGELVQHYWQKHFDALPGVDTIASVPVARIIGAVEKRYLPEDFMPVLQLEITTPQKDSLMITYGDEVVKYEIQPPKTTLYLEYEGPKLKSIATLAHSKPRAKVVIGAFR